MTSNIPITRIYASLAVTTLVLVFIGSTSAQTTSVTDAATPSALTPGAPAGSYALSGFENVNLFNGNLNFALPLVHVGGRGGAEFTMMLNIEQHWRIRTPKPPKNCELTGTCNLRVPWPGWWGNNVDYGPGVLQGRQPGVQCGNLSLTRLTFTVPGGTEFELRDQNYGGQPLPFQCNPAQGASRGTVFVTADGSAATFISDTSIYDNASQNSIVFYPSGYLMLRDGTRYRIDEGKVTWLHDRNGNKMTFAYSGWKVTTITDSLNRQVNIAYSVADVAPYGTCDQITFKGFGGAQRTLRISKTTLANVLRTTQPGDSSTAWTFKQLFPDLDGSAVSQHNSTVVSSIWLPDGQRRYKLYYNVYSELARVELPTGGAIEYDFANAQNPYDGIYRRVTERRVYANGVNLESKNTYSDGIGGSVIVDSRDASDTLLIRSKHYFYGNPMSSLGQLPTSYSEWKEGREYRTEVFDSDGTTLLNVTTSTWQQRVAVPWWTGSFDSAPPNDPRLSETTFTLADTNQVSRQTFLYDDSVPFNNRTDVYEYDFGSGGAPGALVRRTRTEYLKINPVNGTDYTTTGIHIRNLPTKIQVFDSLGAEKARTTFEYDNYTGGGNHAELEPRPNIAGLDSGFTTSYVTRGNTTDTTGWILSSSTQLHSYRQYDIAGNVVKTIDPRGFATLFEFADRFGVPDGESQGNMIPSELGGQTSYAFATKITNAAGHISYAQFDYYLGKFVNGQDPNGIVAAGSYNDSLDRPTQVKRAIGTLAENQTTFTYDDANRVVTTMSDRDINADNGLIRKQFYDGLGRTLETRQYEGGTNFIVTEQQYDALGRANKISSPYRPYNETAVWTTTVFDALGRVTSVTTPDSAVINTAYSGNAVTVTDQAGKVRRSITDVLGRLSRVDEPGGSNNLGSVGSPNQPTYYTYDVLDNLTAVNQGLQSRAFLYDSLRRLISATNPESGTVTYSYDANGNLISKTDARSITTTFVYDAINRVTSKSYSDTPQTPTVNYFYDSQSLPVGAPTFDRGYSAGRLVAVTYGSASSEGTYRSYDQFGRVSRKYQRTDSSNYLVEASYYANSSLKTQTYPTVPGAVDRRVVSYTNDVAGRLGSLTSLATSYAPAASVSAIGYASHNALNTQTYGNGLVNSINYNDRLQPTEIKLGTSGVPSSVMGLTYNYGTTNNNGNVLTINYSGGGLGYTQSFGYDSLNRLTTSQETNGSPSWSQTNGYDRYGNRWIDLGGGNQSLYFNAGNNRNTGWSYDNAGNLLNDGSHTYAFNADNRIRTIDSQSAYIYNGEGQRVRKLLGESLRLIYGIGDALIAEFDGTTGALKKEYIYGANGLVATIEPTTLNANGTRYSTADHLGSPRVLTNSSAGVISRHDYMPFGEELGAGVGGRSTGMGFSVADGQRQKFTSYERDSESTLDYAGARFYATTQGRFTSVDPLMASAIAADPQTFNRYTYVLNSPLTLIDPTGMFATGLSGGCTGGDSGIPLVSLTQQATPAQPPAQPPPQQPKILDLRKDPLIVAAVQEIQENAAPLKAGEKPVLTSVMVVPGQVSKVENTKLIDAYGNVLPTPFTGTVQPIGVIPLDQGCNIIAPGNGVLLQEKVTAVKGPDPGSSNPVPAPDSGVFIDLQTIGKGWPTVEIKQNVKVQQGRIQIEIGPNRVIKDAGAGTISFTQGPQTKRVF